MTSTRTEPRDCRLSISEDLFRLTTESLRLHSNATFEHQTLATLIDLRALGEPALHDHDLSTLGEHLGIVPGIGGIGLEVTITARSLEYLQALQRAFSKRLGMSLGLEDALSLLLFDYIVENRAAKVLQILQIETNPAAPDDSGGSCH